MTSPFEDRSFLVEHYDQFVNNLLDPKLSDYSLMLLLSGLVGDQHERSKEPSIKLVLEHASKLSKAYKAAWPWKRRKILADAKQSLLASLLQLGK